MIVEQLATVASAESGSAPITQKTKLGTAVHSKPAKRVAKDNKGSRLANRGSIPILSVRRSEFTLC